MRISYIILTVLLYKTEHIFGQNAIQGAIAGIFDPSCVIVTGDCPNKNITFWLYTNATVNEPRLLDPINLQKSDFPVRRPLKILIHGYTGYRDFAPSSYIRPVLLEHEDVYVISVDYGPLVREPCYTQAVQNVPLVSRCIAQFINNLVEQDIVPNEDVHVIGFSLGGQVAGQTANYVTKKLKRITGLDPAKPLYVTASNKHKLSKDDADFVDVIHTDVFGRGMLSPMGHIDFYPNIGSVQPGCESEPETGSCNHDRAPRFYAESIIPTNEFWASHCGNWFSYVFNLCDLTSNDALMGYYVDESLSGIHFLKTSNTPPFALGLITERQSPRANLSFATVIEKLKNETGSILPLD